MNLEDNENYKIVLTHFPRIANSIALFWDTIKVSEYIGGLLFDTRNGARRGFPEEVATALFRLLDDHMTQFPKLYLPKEGKGINLTYF